MVIFAHFSQTTFDSHNHIMNFIANNTQSSLLLSSIKRLQFCRSLPSSLVSIEIPFILEEFAAPDSILDSYLFHFRYKSTSFFSNIFFNFCGLFSTSFSPIINIRDCLQRAVIFNL